MNHEFLKTAVALRRAAAMTVFCCVYLWGQNARSPGRLIEILADHDSRYKVEGQKQPVITVKGRRASHPADYREEGEER